MTYRFGLFEFESGPGELRKAGRPVALEPQPSRALGVLLARAGELVTRGELKEAVWDKGTHVDFDRGLAYCISQIRTALGDAGDSPRFIQTVPRKGYRFIAPVESPVPVPETRDATKGRRSVYLAVLGALVLGAAVVAGVALRGPAPLREGAAKTPARAVVAVSVFDNETGLAEYDRLVSGLSDLVVTRLTVLAPDRVAVIGNAAVLRRPRNIRDLKAVAAGVRADYVLLGQLQLHLPEQPVEPGLPQQADAGLRFITHFIRLSDETHLKANRLSFPNGDLSSLEQAVATEFERAVRQHVLPNE